TTYLITSLYSPSNLGATLFHEKFECIFSNALEEIFRVNSSSDNIDATAVAHSNALPEVNNIPSCLCCMISGMPPTDEATTGRPQLIASRITIDCASDLEGSTSTSAALWI